MRPHGHARVNARSPEAAGICDRCSRLWSHRDLRWQWGWQGLRLQNLRILVCAECYDIPNRQQGAKPVSSDPLPIYNARPEPFTVTGFGYDESNIMEQPTIYYPPFGSLPRKPWAADGLQMLMPDGITVMLMPTNPSGV
jgi:hypothetical protein